MPKAQPHPIDWTPALTRRDGAALQRLAFGLAAAVLTGSLIGWSLALGWLGVYGAIQALERGLTRAALGRPARLSHRMWRGLLVAAAASNAAAFSAIALPLWSVGGLAGGVCASIILAAACVNTVASAPRSATLMGWTLAAPAALLLATPVWLNGSGASDALVLSSAAASLILVMLCADGWRRAEREARARALTDTARDRERDATAAAMAAQTAFLTTIGHDLRTPISAILAGASAIDRQSTDTGPRAHAALITDAGLMMKALLDDLLDSAKLNAGRMTVEVVDFDARALILQTVRLWRGPARAKGLRLRIEGARRVPLGLRGDPMRLRQVLNNLISNAMKFTDEGSVGLILNAWPDDQGGHHLVIQVRDTGPGMTAEQAARLFTPFDQLADGVSARHGGSGLGLSISRDLVQLMGGRLTAHSRPGEGAAFTVALTLPDAEPPGEPAAPPAPVVGSAEDLLRALSAGAAPIGAQPTADTPVVPAAADAAEPEAAPEDADRPLRVLVVDDHDINRRAVELILRPLGCDLAAAADGVAALDLAAAQPFDVIFMDLRMPEMDGREATRRLRAGAGPNAQTPVIAVTADTQAEDIAACLGAGMTYFVAKPLTPAALLGALEHVLAEEGDPTSVAA